MDRITFYYGNKNLGAVEMAMEKLEGELPGRLKRTEWSWMVGYFFLQFDPESCWKLARGQLQAGMAKNQIIEQLFQEYRIYSDFSVGGRWKEEHLFRIEAAFIWCLIQRNHPKGDNAYHQRLRFLFGVDNCIDLVDDEQSSDDELMAADNAIDNDINEMDTSENPRNLIPDDTKRMDVERRIRRDCTREQFLKEAADDSPPGSLPINLAITPFSHIEILDHIIKTAAKEINNFAELLEELGAEKIKEILQEGLNPAIRAMCQGGVFSLEAMNDLGKHAESPVHSTKAGVYLHILSPKSCPGRFWLYIGQSVCLKERIYSHNYNRLKKESSSLHYSVWNSDDMESTWVGLYTHKGRPGLLPRQDRLLLNLAEMWPCCILQTLTAHHLNKYLPSDYEKPWAGCHLNVALPLLQPFSVKEKAEAEVLQSRETFAEYVAANPDDREWATDLRAAFHALRDAPDPVIRGYHKERLRANLNAAHNATQQKAIESMRQYLSGSERAVDVFTTTSAAGFSWDRTSFTCGQFQFTISVDFNLHLKKGNKVFIQFHLADNVHPLKYTANALPTDPASRLAISLTGRDSTSEFHIWLTTSGPKAIKRMNTLIDILEGYSYSERQEMALPGRWWGHWRAEDSKKIQQHYT